MLLSWSGWQLLQLLSALTVISAAKSWLLIAATIDPKKQRRIKLLWASPEILLLRASV
jgi:hypothetical protein